MTAKKLDRCSDGKTYNALAIETGISRTAMNQMQFDQEYGNDHETKRIPLKQHLNFRECLVNDLIGGITTGIMHVPTGLAYASLSRVDPVYGLYASCFPAIFYVLFGTSRHTSLGGMAVVNLMSGIANDNIMHMKATADTIVSTNGTHPADLTPIQVASTLTVAIGIMQFAAGLLRLEFLASYFSDPLVSGFTTGAAVHVVLAQVDDLFGITSLPKASGPGYVFRRSWDIILAAVDRPNHVAVLCSIVAMTFLFCGKEFLSPFLKRKRLAVPVPYELIVIIVSTAASVIFDFQHNCNAPVVGFIPTGPPTPALPVVEILPDCIVQSLGMVVVTIAVHISLAKMYAKKLNYSVDARQELYALGASSMLGGLFSVYPVATTLGQTAVNVSIGTKSQMSTVFSCALLLVIILWLGPLLEALPMCILASVIIVALQGMFRRCDELKSYWRISRTDLLVWIVSFSATVVIDVMEGLAISILFALLTVVFRSQWPKWERVLGSTNSENNQQIQEDASLPCSTVCVFRFDAPLIFTNVERFTSKGKKTVDERDEQYSGNYREIKVEIKDHFQTGLIPRYFIIDCSSIVYIDYMGVKALSETVIDLRNQGLIVFLAAVKSNVFAVLNARGLFANFPKEQLFPTLHDALSIADRSGSSAVILDTEAQSERK